MSLQKTLPIAAGVLSDLVGVDQDLLFRFAPPYGHQQCFQRQIGMPLRLHGPAHDLATEQIEHDGQKQPSLVRANVSDIRDPDLVGLLGLKFR